MSRPWFRRIGWFAGLAGVAISLLAALVIVSASVIFLRLRGITDAEMPEALWCWIPYYLRWGSDTRVRPDLLIAIGIPSGIVVLLTGTVLVALFNNPRRLRPARPGQPPPAPVRAHSDTHGAAIWLPMPKVRGEIFTGPHPGYGGVVVGEAYRVDQDSVANLRFDPKNPDSWGRGGKAPLLIDPCTADSTHGAVFAGSGGYKTTAVTIPTLAHWTGSAVVFDPSCQVGPMTAEMRRKMGHRVMMLGPGQDSFNAVAWIDPKDPLAETHVQAIIEQVTGGAPQDPASDNATFRTRGKELLTCLLADLLWNSKLPPKMKTLREFRQRVQTPEKKMKSLLADIHAESESTLARSLAGTLKDVVAETFSGVYTNATSATQWLSIAAYADMVSGGSFSAKELIDGKLTVFVQIPPECLRANPEIARVTIGSLLNAVYRAQGKVQGRVLFLLDEVNFLGQLNVLEDARDAGRKYGITLVPMWQSLGQLIGTWGEKGRAAWFDSLSWRMFAAVDDAATAEEVSKSCGKYTILARTEGQSNSTQTGLASGGSRNQGRNEGLSEQARELIKPDEVRTRMRADEAIIFRRGAAPIRCGRAIYFRRPELLARIATDPFATAAE